MNPIDPMNPAPGNPWQSSGSGGENPEQARLAFDRSMDPLWRLFHDELARVKPKEWHGYRCEFEVNCVPTTGGRNLRVRFREGEGNRSAALEHCHLHDLAIRLHMAYREFAHALEWRKATFSQTWDEKKQGWGTETELVFGRVEVEPSPDTAGGMGLS